MSHSRTKKKILFIITKSNFGGAQRYVYDIVRSLPHNEFEATVAFGGKGALKDKLDAARVQTVSIEGLERDVSFASECKVFFKLLRLFRDESPDIVHLNSSKIGGIGALVGRLMHIPHIVFTAHGWAFNEERPWLERKMIAFLHWCTIILSHTTIAVSHTIKRQVGHFPFIAGKIIVIYNGIDQAGTFSREEARTLLLSHNKKLAESTPKGTLWIGTVSELHRTKGLPYAIRAVKQLVDSGYNVIFFIISEGEERRNLQELIRKNALEKRIFLFGFLDSAAQYLRAFDIFTLTSISEALSYTILEAGLSECAVVASNVGGIPEIIVDGESGMLVPARDPHAIAEALVVLIKNKKRRILLGESLERTVKKKFTLEEMLSQTLLVYRSRT
ncbi:glycosyltransferase [Candidatus Kaiserbacteria bacterium]|nr:glycosyltransferase [Candidatus Kaiserbacteria bacterium]